MFQLVVSPSLTAESLGAGGRGSGGRGFWPGTQVGYGDGSDGGLRRPGARDARRALRRCRDCRDGGAAAGAAGHGAPIGPALLLSARCASSRDQLEVSTKILFCFSVPTHA